MRNNTEDEVYLKDSLLISAHTTITVIGIKNGADAHGTYHQIMVGDETGSAFLYVYGIDGTLIESSHILSIQGAY